MRRVLVRVSHFPGGWSACSALVRRRRPVLAWGVFQNEDGREVAGLVAAGATVRRADLIPGFEGYAPGPGCEPQFDPPELPAADLTSAINQAVDVELPDWELYEARIRSALEAAARYEWATASLAGFTADPHRWFRLWRRGRREVDATVDDLMARLRALSHRAPGRSLEDALVVAGTTLGALIASTSVTSTEEEK